MINERTDSVERWSKWKVRSTADKIIYVFQKQSKNLFKCFKNDERTDSWSTTETLLVHWMKNERTDSKDPNVSWLKWKVHPTFTWNDNSKFFISSMFQKERWTNKISKSFWTIWSDQWNEQYWSTVNFMENM